MSAATTDKVSYVNQRVMTPHGEGKAVSVPFGRVKVQLDSGDMATFEKGEVVLLESGTESKPQPPEPPTIQPLPPFPVPVDDEYKRGVTRKIVDRTEFILSGADSMPDNQMTHLSLTPWRYIGVLRFEADGGYNAATIMNRALALTKQAFSGGRMGPPIPGGLPSCTTLPPYHDRNRLMVTVEILPPEED